MGTQGEDLDWARTAAYVQKVMDSQGISNAELHRRGGPSVNTTSDFLRSIRSPEPGTITKIETGLALDSGTLRRVALGEAVAIPSQVSPVSDSVPSNVVWVTQRTSPGVEVDFRIPYDGPEDRVTVLRMITEALRDIAAGSGGGVEEGSSGR